MKKSIEKFVALLSCVTIMMSISSRVYADTYEVESENEYSIAVYSTDKAIIKYPNKPNFMK